MQNIQEKQQKNKNIKKYVPLCILLLCSVLLLCSCSPNKLVIPAKLMQYSENMYNMYQSLTKEVFEQAKNAEDPYTKEQIANKGMLYYENENFVYEGSATQKKAFVEELENEIRISVDTQNYHVTYPDTLPSENSSDFFNMVTGDEDYYSKLQQTEIIPHPLEVNEDFTEYVCLEGSDAQKEFDKADNVLVVSALLVQYLRGNKNPEVIVRYIDDDGNTVKEQTFSI